MRDSKGISMISLIVTILCVILLSSMAIGTGTKYIRESRAQNREIFVSVMSSAVARRQEDINLNSNAYQYLGYYIGERTIFESIFAPKVTEHITFEDSVWYVVDTTAARYLGVKEPEKYIETVDENYTEEITVALVDYRSAKVYLIDAHSAEISGLPNDGYDEMGGHEHRYVDPDKYPTCTEPKKCADCGFIAEEAKGHSYENLASPEPAVGDEENAHYTKVCTVPDCGMQGGYERHIFEYEHLIKNGVWHHKASCNVCGYVRKNADGTEREDPCTIAVSLPENEALKLQKHIKTCLVCLHQETEEHLVKFRSISETMHEKYCDDPLCKHLIAREFHRDNDSDEFCDDCGAVIISYDYPQFSVVKMEKTIPIPANDSEKYIAKYGDTIKLTFVADRKIKNLKVHIGGYPMDAGIATITEGSSNTWTVEYTLSNARSLPDGEIKFEINCESQFGVLLPSPVTRTTDNKKVIFDGTVPTIEYIPKPDRIDEED